MDIRNSRRKEYVLLLSIWTLQSFTATHVKLEKIADSTRKNRAEANRIKLAEKDRIPTDVKYYNPRVTYDGLHWWLSVGVEAYEHITSASNEGIGIDIGIKSLAVCSNSTVYENINKTKEVKRLKKKKRRLQRSISRRYIKNKEGESYCKTNNIVKSEKELLKLNHRLTDIRHNHIHQVTAEIVKQKPSFIVTEDLNVKGMMKNKHLSQAIQEQCLAEFISLIEYKSYWNGIEYIRADRYYPSSKLCHICKTVKEDLMLKDRTYKCEYCKNTIDRDLQAALNLRDYGEQLLGVV
jgi:putative transposase